MRQREEKRRFWSGVVARFEEAGLSQERFAVQAGVSLPGFRYWLYKLRGERQVGGRPTAEVRLVPVTVTARAEAPTRLEVCVGGIRVRVPVGADPGYVARLATALREARTC